MRIRVKRGRSVQSYPATPAGVYLSGMMPGEVPSVVITFDLIPPRDPVVEAVALAARHCGEWWQRKQARMRRMARKRRRGWA